MLWAALLLEAPSPIEAGMAPGAGRPAVADPPGRAGGEAAGACAPGAGPAAGAGDPAPPAGAAAGRCAPADLATWALQFTPRVALAEAGRAVLLEAQASARLYGGRRALQQRVNAEASALGVERLGWAPTGLAAIAFARCGVADGLARPLHELLDALPLEALSAVGAQRATLSQLGCRTLGQVRALPRGGLGRRFERGLLAALDRAYGLAPEAHAWHVAPPSFSARLELPQRVEHAPVLLHAARRLLLAMCGWLAARQAGVASFTLRWRHDAMRPRGAGEGGELTVATAEPTRSVEHLARLLAEHLARATLAAPAGEIELVAGEVRPLAPSSASLLPGARPGDEPLVLVLERIAARLGPGRVLRPLPLADHRPEWTVRWQPAPRPLPLPAGAAAAFAADGLPQPAFLLAEPLRLATRGPQPLYQGVLRLLAGPHRVEGGWWHRTPGPGGATAMHHVCRDYWVAESEHAGVLWVFQARLADGDDGTAWFLHGCFA